MDGITDRAPDCPDCESDRTGLWGGRRADILCWDCQQFKVVA